MTYFVSMKPASLKQLHVSPDSENAKQEAYDNFIHISCFVALWLGGYGVGFGTERSRVRLPVAAFE